ncbi:MAG TPA: aldo/keto reductase [Solirubrobacterales bacterium]|nr:aldo/keto reductase [Solirubrobacterales bacterium]
MSTFTIHATTLPSGETVPVLGQGTWHMAEGRHPRDVEIEALRFAINLGVTLIDTAEMYADGGAEELVGEAIEGVRDEVFLVSKVLPSHADREGTINACRASLRRLQTNHIDLYLLHWRGDAPLIETITAFEELRMLGAIRNWGVSNFDLADMAELMELRDGDHVAANQVLYNLAHRGVEWDLLPWHQAQGIPLMAYSPIEQGRLLDHPAIRAIAERHHVTPAQVALAWVLREEGVIAIPEAGTQDHVKENRAAVKLHLEDEDLAELDRDFPPPSGPQPLATH